MGPGSLCGEDRSAIQVSPATPASGTVAPPVLPQRARRCPRETTVCRAVGTGCGGGKKDLLVVPQRPVGALAWRGFPVRLKGKAWQDWGP